MRPALSSALLLHLALRGVAADEWRVASTVDPRSQDEMPAAIARNAGGFTLAVYRDGATPAVVGVFRLPAGVLDLLDGAAPPVLVIDGGAPIEMRLLAGELKWLRFHLWQGDGEPLVGGLRELMEGGAVSVRYQLYGGGYKEARFALAGAKAAIAEVLGVRAEISAVELAAARDLDAESSAALERCLGLSKKKEQERCLERLSVCTSTPPADAAALRSCLTRDGS